MPYDFKIKQAIGQDLPGADIVDNHRALATYRFFVDYDSDRSDRTT